MDFWFVVLGTMYILGIGFAIVTYIFKLFNLGPVPTDGKFNGVARSQKPVDYNNVEQ